MADHARTETAAGPRADADARPDSASVGPGIPSPSRQAPTTPPPSVLSPVELFRWAWRQLTSMRTALILLFLLAVAAIPGSVIPQSAIAPSEVFAFREANPELAVWYDRLGLFNVYTSVWFGAVYVLLMVSLVGCIVPRTRLYLRGLRAQPPAAPRRLSRLPEHREWVDGGSPEQVAERAAVVLRRNRFRTRSYLDAQGRHVVAAERGRLREAGNLVFHLSVLVVLLGVAVGSLFGFKGASYIVEGQGFSNSLTQYDEFRPGALFDADGLVPFSFTLDSFRVSYQLTGEQRGAPRSFDATVTYTGRPGAPERTRDIEVNDPLHIGNTSVFLVGNGYAPSVTVRDGNGDVAFSGPVPFLPQDSSNTSFGVIKVPDARPTQLGFEGYFLPTYSITPELGPHSVFPDALDPALVLTGYTGNLGMDDGPAQSVYVLDKDRLTQMTRDGEKYRLLLRPGQTQQLPGGAGSITFDGVDRAVQMQISSTPGKGIALAGVVLALLGLIASLYVRPRRVWVRVGDGAAGADGGAGSAGADGPTGEDGATGDDAGATGDDAGGTVVEAAGLDRVSGGDLAAGMDRLVSQFRDDPKDVR